MMRICANVCWGKVISRKASPLRARGMKCQLNRSSSRSSNMAVARCSGVRAVRKFVAAVAISPPTLWAKLRGVVKGSNSMVAVKRAVGKRMAKGQRIRCLNANIIPVLGRVSETAWPVLIASLTWGA